MINLKAYFTGFNSKADNSFSIRFTTQELPPEYAADFARALNQFGHLIFKEGEIQEDEIPTEIPIDEDAKTPSQRLRGVLYRLWSKKKEKSPNIEPFDYYYRKQYEKLIELYKEKLD